MLRWTPCCWFTAVEADQPGFRGEGAAGAPGADCEKPAIARPGGRARGGEKREVLSETGKKDQKERAGCAMREERLRRMLQRERCAALTVGLSVLAEWMEGCRRRRSCSVPLSLGGKQGGGGEASSARGQTRRLAPARADGRATVTN